MLVNVRSTPSIWRMRLSRASKSAVFAVGVTAPLLSLLADFIPRRLLLRVSLALFSLATLVCALTPTLLVLSMHSVPSLVNALQATGDSSSPSTPSPPILD